MKVLVTGANGQLGWDVARRLNRLGIENRGVDIADFDLTDEAAVMAIARAYAPTHIVHCAAYTAVDKAETERELCTAVNVGGTRHIARACAELGAEMMYFSTDYVFDGFSKTTPWETDDEKAPQNHYGLTKYQGELEVQKALENYYIVRISWVFGANGTNFVKTMLRLAEGGKTDISVVDDQYGAPTYTADEAALACDLLRSGKYGVYHAPNSGDCSWYEFAREIFRQANSGVGVVPVSTEQYPTAARRPKNSRLSQKSLDAAGFARLPGYEGALTRYLEETGVI